MDGLHKLKTPGLYASLFFQISSIYLLFQATNLRSHSFLQEGLPRRAQRDAQVPMESPMRAQEIQCSEGLAAYQWGAIGSILLSIGCLSPLMLFRRKEESHSFSMAKSPVVSRTPEPDIDSEGAWMKEPVYRSDTVAARRSDTGREVGQRSAAAALDSTYRSEGAWTKDSSRRPEAPRDNTYRAASASLDSRKKESLRSESASEGAWKKDARRNEIASSEGAWMKEPVRAEIPREEAAFVSETLRTETYRSDGSHRSESHRSEAAYRSDGALRSEGAYRSESTWLTEPAYRGDGGNEIADNSPGGVVRSLKKGLEELELLLKNQPATVSGDSKLLRTIGDNIRVLESRNRSTYESLLAGHDEIQKASSRLQRLMEQCRESANYSAANRVDWKKNKLIDILSQMRQNLDLVVDLSKNVNSIHASTLRLLGESLHSESILNEKIGRTQEQLERIQTLAQAGTKVHDTIISIIGESRDNITGATKFVGSVAQKWDSLVHLTEQIDDVADRINAQSMAASLEMSRSQSHQNVTDLFPFGTELRSLAATFHTYARQFKDAVHDVRDEMGKTNTYLSQAGSKADHAFVSVSQCAEYYRGSVNAVKHSASELTLLQQEVNIHMKKLLETRVMGQTSADILTQLDRHLQGHNGYGMKIMDETSQITVHSEKISTLLAKQYHELNHSQKILASSAPLLTDSIRFTMETTQTVATLAACLDRSHGVDDSIAMENQSRQDEVLIAKVEHFKQLIASIKEPVALEAGVPGSVMKQKTLAAQQPRTPATWRVMN